MGKKNKKAERRLRIRKSIRAKINGTPERPRLSVFRSNRHIVAQLIDDTHGHTLAAASSLESNIAAAQRTDVSKQVGELLAERAKEAGIETCVFDRGGYPYHGRVQALADGARAGGLKF